MGYEHVRVEELEDAPNPTRHKKEVDEAVGAGTFGFNVMVADEGQQLPWGYHEHPDHEELFYVLAGEVAFETPEGEFAVGPGEAFFVPAGHPQKGVATEDDTRVVAAGAPKDGDDAVVMEECPECGAETDRDYQSVVEDGGTAYVLYCADCGAQVDRLEAGPSTS